MRATRRQPRSGQQRPAWPGNANYGRARLGLTRRASSGIFGYTGGHGASGMPLARSSLVALDERGDRLRRGVDGGPRIAAGGEPARAPTGP